jgi:hypothetical protein
MTEAELERYVKECLNNSGLLAYLDPSSSQFLEIPGGWFCEVVVTDSTKLDGARQVIADAAAGLNAEGVSLDTVIRALWRVEDVKYVGPCRGESGGIKFAECFEATLACGFGRTKSTIEVSHDALDTIRGTLGTKLPSAQQERNEVLEDIVRTFVEYQLHQGGTSYWDPVQFSTLQMNAASFQYIWGHSAA